MESRAFYIAKNTGFLLEQNEQLVPATISQPTPEGVMALCSHYSQKYSIDLQCLDFRPHLARGDNIHHFFKYLLNDMSEILVLEENQSRGLILSYGQHHVIPLLITQRDGVKHMISFDSTSGCRIKGYFLIANMFNDFQFYLNIGTRQSDDGSCMTDAICILKEALLLNNLVDLIHNKQTPFQQEPMRNSCLRVVTQPDNFFLFKMPEQLLLTAQRSKYLEDSEADINVILRGGKSLKNYRDDFLLEVILESEPARATTPINGYLYLKSLEHKVILERYANQSRPPIEELEIDRNDSPSIARRGEPVDLSPYPQNTRFTNSL